MADPKDPRIIAAGAGALVGAAFVKDVVIDDDDDVSEGGLDGDFGLFGGDDLGGDSETAAFDADLGSDDGDYADALAEYQNEQLAYETTSEMMEMQHQTNMEVIDNIDGSDDYYYEETTDW